MEVKEVLYMKKGDGEDSYAQNSSFTQRVVALSKPALERAVEYLFGEGHNAVANKVLNVVDLGCGSGPSSFSVISSVIENVQKKCEELNCQVPEFQFYLNDLPGNDFNTLFRGLSDFAERYNDNNNKDVSLFIMGTPGSFHGRLFPANTLHLVHSSYSVHWLSKVPSLVDEAGLPLNRGKIYISKTSPAVVKEAYVAQFEQDFGLFLRSRSQEMVPNGRLVLVINGTPAGADYSRVYSYPWEPLADAIIALVSQGLIEEDRSDSFNIPLYNPSEEEVKSVVSKEGSFEIEQLDTFPIEIGDRNVWDNAEKLCKNVRSFTESMISHQFGEDIVDKLYEKFSQITVQDLVTNEEPYKIFSLIVVLRRN